MRTATPARHNPKYGPVVHFTDPGLLAPRYYTPPLSDDFTSDGPQLRYLFRQVWKDPQSGEFMELDRWQCAAIDHLLETYPDEWEDESLVGELRHRQACCILPRQSGKSVIGGALTLKALFLHVKSPIVVGTAGRNAAQAGIVFSRLRNTIRSSKNLANEFRRTPSARTMELKSGGTYVLYPARGDAVQGQDLTWGLLDELHLARPDLWAALMLGQRGQPRSLLIGISTAGDESCELVNSLTEQGRDLSDTPDPDSRFCYMEWSAPENLDVRSPEAVLSCNPRIYEGKISLTTVMQENKALTERDVARYVLCRTVRKTNSWMPLDHWQATTRKWPELPDGLKPTVVSVEITPGSTYATLTTAAVDDAGRVHTALYASVPNPPDSTIVEMLAELEDVYPDITVALDSYSGKGVAKLLVDEGTEPRMVTLADIANATAWAMAAIKDRRLTHCGTGLLNRQVRNAEAKLLPRGGYRVVPPKGGHNYVDAIQSFIVAGWMANKLADEPRETALGIGFG
jgi:phage terminase large subunit-like protein